ncbi:MAG: hypothetical protein A3B10_02960 [Candidatus Doudnabacteria bacterium RIFCSPLOWO2_01_FULL_44_21]|uniref:Cytoskeleton protein RodZ-like C-terminal domain-containing protein n=1 Tax=Candidatus Doudnabacteria bacterium RIFCSPLOWO2_01_FULL_44_21 TaxID=1817841 RepID=A0A1F5Q267_9BACT|nr:MAG: hypothetical protein A3B95_03225 [Candidatus Doudnabacteria bacterium RIFCSPHIGHO2_02_FULL_43_13b]OGE96246.1 MAG: hypothetical protein A3B10_02960 [Candidatus Doudnabacteria bacterium RIFCSPLOWO2_01_FULL_44_21]
MAEAALFQTKTVKIDTLGEYLVLVRKQLNLDLKTVSLLSQIKLSYLEDLEAGNYSKLPAEVYIRGFLKSLSQLYRIKEQILIDQYEKERGIEPITQKHKPKVRTESVLTPKTLIIGSSLLIGLVALLYVGNQVRSVLAPPFLEIVEPGSDLTIDGNSLVVSGKTEIGADVFINNQQVLADSSGQFSENLLLSPGLNIVEISSQNKFGKISKITRQINSQTQTVPTTPPSSVNITINIGPGSAWVYLEADGVVVQRGTMLAGSSRTVTAKIDILLTSANAGSTVVVYNGKDLGKLGREGEVIRNVEFRSQ